MHCPTHVILMSYTAPTGILAYTHRRVNSHKAQIEDIMALKKLTDNINNCPVCRVCVLLSRLVMQIGMEGVWDAVGVSRVRCYSLKL